MWSCTRYFSCTHKCRLKKIYGTPIQSGADKWGVFKELINDAEQSNIAGFLSAMTSHNTRHFSKNLFALVIVQWNIPLCQISLIFKILGVFWKKPDLFCNRMTLLINCNRWLTRRGHDYQSINGMVYFKYHEVAIMIWLRFDFHLLHLVFAQSV